MALVYSYFILLAFVSGSVLSETSCEEDYPCVKVTECKADLEGTLIYPCSKNEDKQIYICCPNITSKKTNKFTNEKNFSEIYLNTEANRISSKVDSYITNYNNSFITHNILDKTNLNLNKSLVNHNNTQIKNDSNSFYHTKPQTFKQNNNSSWFSNSKYTPNYNKDQSPSNINTNRLQHTSERVEKEAIIISKLKQLFPQKCGLTSSDNKITGGSIAELGQFPWMALLGFRQAHVPVVQFNCGGSVISRRFVLSAAHCVVLNRPLELILIRFGEHNLTSNIDCMLFGKTKICADKYIDITVERTILHHQFDPNNLKNDIALIKLMSRIPYSEYIKPVCLPYHDISNTVLDNQTFVVSGWGKTSSENLAGSTTLQYANVKVWNQQHCDNYAPLQVRPIDSSQICANGPKNEDACKGDSGGPLVNSTKGDDGEIRYFQIGIVSFASTTACGDFKLPTVYTRVGKFLEWIVNNV